MRKRSQPTTETALVPASKPKQGELFHADLRYIAILSALYTSGTAAKVGPVAVSTFVCLRINADFKTGLVSIGQRRIAQQVGCSVGSVHRAINTLLDAGLIKLAKSAYRNCYEITDHIPVFHEDNLAGSMAIPFAPLAFRDNLDAARSTLVDGRPPSGNKAVVINLYNIQNNNGIVVINNTNGEKPNETTFDLGSLPMEIRGFFERMVKG